MAEPDDALSLARFRKVQRPGVPFILAAAILWSSLGVAGKLAFRNGVIPLEAAFYRAAVAFVCLLVFLGATKPGALRVRLPDLGLFAAFGLVSVAAFFIVYLEAIRETTVATAAILLYTAPAFVIILSALLFGEPLTPPRRLLSHARLSDVRWWAADTTCPACD
jgi:DME family drug/metabolite transporter